MRVLQVGEPGRVVDQEELEVRTEGRFHDPRVAAVGVDRVGEEPPDAREAVGVVEDLLDGLPEPFPRLVHLVEQVKARCGGRSLMPGVGDRLGELRLPMAEGGGGAIAWAA